MPRLNRAFRLEDYRSATSGFEIEKTIFMEVDVGEADMLKEARFYGAIAEDENSIVAGIIAAVRPERDGFSEHLDSIANASLKGVRRVLHVVPDEISTSALFRENVRTLSRYGIPFDMCFWSRQLGLAYELAAACPEVQFVLDHCGNPDIANGELDEWRQRICKLATLPNLVCKLSGIAVDCGEKTPTEQLLTPYLDECLEAFGADRLVFGSDWPVCLLAIEAKGWFGIFTSWCSAALSESEQEKVCWRNATRVYKL